MRRAILIVAALALMLGGCAHVVSKELRDEVDKDLRAEDLFRQPELSRGKTAVLGGVILGLEHTNEGDAIKVLQRPLNFRGKPRDTEVSHGRFIVLHLGRLDRAAFSPGRLITVGGQVMGHTVRHDGDRSYLYLLVTDREVFLHPSKGFGRD